MPHLTPDATAPMARPQADAIRARDALDAVPDPISIASAIRGRRGWITDFRIDYLNPAARKWAGLDKGRTDAPSLLAILPSIERSGLLDAFRVVVETRERYEVNALAFEDEVPGGSSIRGVYDLWVVPLGDGYMSTWRDVSDRERTIADLTSASELVRAIVDTSPFGTMAFDLERRIIFWNAGAEQMFGWSADEVVGHRFPRETIPDAEVEASANLVQRTLEGTPVRGERVTRRTRDGRELRIEIHGGPLRDRSGAVIGYAGQMVDVTRLREVEDDLALVGRVAAMLAGAVTHITAGASFEAAAGAICERLQSLPAIDVTAIGAFGEADVVLLAASASEGIPLRAGDRLPNHRAASLRARAADGPWAQYWESVPEDGAWGRALDASGLTAFAFGPIVHDSHVDGGLMIGTRDATFARTLVEKWSSIVDFTTAPSALLAERLHARREQFAVRRSIDATIRERAFHPVFQPIVELASGEVVGHEALTRFASGRRPDHVFHDAWTVGLGHELELATLAAAIADARRLPDSLWLDLNVSPRLLAEPVQLRRILHAADRPIVLEVTEHEIVDDYDALIRAVRYLGHDMRLAVDDAGAGVANFAHIIDLRPDFVKLDQSLVRRVNAHLGRQALIVGMRYFSRTSGCRLVAEGVETGEEARTLAQLGVEFGQGYWFGRPQPVGA